MEDNPGVWEESIFHETKLRTGLESNTAKQLIAKLRITAGYKPVKRSLGPYFTSYLFWFFFFNFLFPCQTKFLLKISSCIIGCYGEKGSAHSWGGSSAAANLAVEVCTLSPACRTLLSRGALKEERRAGAREGQ